MVGEAATAENDFCFDYLPRINGDHSHYAMMLKALDGGVKGMFAVGQNPTVGSANSSLIRRALRRLDWLVVRDLHPNETALFWRDSPEHEAGETRAEDISTEVFFLPAAAHTEKDGTFTNTQRLLQWHHKAVEPQGDARSELHWIYHLGARIREKLAGSTDPRDRPVLDLTWDYPLQGPQGEPDAERVLQEISGRRADGSFLASYDDLQPDGRTACGSWIHCGVYKDGVNQSARRRPHTEQNWIAHQWGWAWPKDVRIIYNRASADPEGRPWSERKRYTWWDPGQGNWVTLGDTPTSRRRRRRTTFHRRPPPRWRRSAGTSHSSCTRTVAAGCTRRRGSSTARSRRTTSRRSLRWPTRCTPSSRTRRGRCSTVPRTRITRPTASSAATSSPSCSRPTG
jgi:formate dehydrogenase major subunit